MRFELRVFVTRSYLWKLPFIKTRLCYPKIENGNCEPNFLSQKVYTDINYIGQISIVMLGFVSTNEQ